MRFFSATLVATASLLLSPVLIPSSFAGEPHGHEMAKEKETHAGDAKGHDETSQMDHDALHVAHGWARASLGQNPNSAAYITIHNPTAEADRVLAVSCEAAERCEIHNHMKVDNVMTMRKVAALEIAPGAHLTFKPGGLHVMMFGLKAPLQAGESTKLILTFEKAGDVAVVADVLSLADAAKRAKDGEGKDDNAGQEQEHGQDHGQEHGHHGH